MKRLIETEKLLEEEELFSKYASQGGRTTIDIFYDKKWGGKGYSYQENYSSGSGLSYEALLATIANKYFDTPSLECIEGEELSGQVCIYNGMFFSMDDPRVEKNIDKLQNFIFDIVLNKREMKKAISYAKEHYKDTL